MRTRWKEYGTREKGKFLRLNVLTALVCILVIGWDGTAESSPTGLRVGERTEILFGSVEEGRPILCSRDEYIEKMSPFDRSARMKTAREVSIEEFVAFVGTQVAAWQNDEKERVGNALLGIRAGLEGAPFPDMGIITMIKTTGEEEANKAYTRGKAVVLPQAMIHDPKIDLKRVLAHELFHVISRNMPMVRFSLYEAIGFRYCGELDFPTSLSRITTLTHQETIMSSV